MAATAGFRFMRDIPDLHGLPKQHSRDYRAERRKLALKSTMVGGTLVRDMPNLFPYGVRLLLSRNAHGDIAGDFGNLRIVRDMGGSPAAGESKRSG